MDLIHYPVLDEDRDPILLVMLSGFGMEAAEFAENGFVRIVQEAGRPIEVVAASPSLQLYFDGTVAEEIERTIVEPERARGRARIWLLGISLGGMGALLHARAYPAGVEGLILLAPFLGTPGILAEIATAGGLAHWRPGKIVAADSERQVLAWLKNHLAAPSPQPAIYLGYGLSDRFAKGHAMLGERLPAGRVALDEGCHDWPTWTSLWQRILALNPFACDAR